MHYLNKGEQMNITFYIHSTGRQYFLTALGGAAVRISQNMYTRLQRHSVDAGDEMVNRRVRTKRILNIEDLNFENNYNYNTYRLYDFLERNYRSWRNYTTITSEIVYDENALSWDALFQ